MKLPKLDWALAEHWPHNEIIIGAMNLGRELDSAEAAEVIRRVELHDELAEAAREVLESSLGRQLMADAIPGGQLPMACGKTYLANKMQTLQAVLAKASPSKES